MGCAWSVRTFPTSGPSPTLAIIPGVEGEAELDSKSHFLNQELEQDDFDPSGTEIMFHDKYRMENQIGRGAFSQVYLARKANDEGGALAVKVIDQRELVDNKPVDKLDSSAREAVKREVRILRVVRHWDCCIQLVDAFLSGCYGYVVMQQCELTLQRHLELMPVLSETTLMEVLRQMISAIRCIHCAMIVHRDVKPDNYLVHDGHVKLCDFGMAEVVDRRCKFLRGIFGTAPYMSPEMLTGQKYNLSTDVWSFAVIAYVLFLGRFPYLPAERNPKAMKAAIVVGQPEPDFQPHHGVPRLSPTAEASLRRALVRSPQERPGATELTAALKGEVRNESLRPALSAAKRLGAFAAPNGKLNPELELHVRQLQGKFHGAPVAEMTSSPRGAIRKPSATKHRDIEL